MVCTLTKVRYLEVYAICSFSWGSNKQGRLGYSAPDSVWSPRKITSFKHQIVSVSAANKHSAALSTSGKLYTWGDNTCGQLGYGTQGRAFSFTPRIVDAVRDRKISAVSLAKRHTVVLTGEGEVLVWGHKNVSVSRVPVHGVRDKARSMRALRMLSGAQVPSGHSPGGWGSMGVPRSCSGGARRSGGSSGPGAVAHFRFHRDNAAVVNPTILAIAAGGAHTTMLTSTGAVLTYHSDDPQFAVQEVQGVLGAKCVVKIAAGKTHTVVLTDTGEAYAWEGTVTPSGTFPYIS